MSVDLGSIALEKVSMHLVVELDMVGGASETMNLQEGVPMKSSNITLNP